MPTCQKKHNGRPTRTVNARDLLWLLLLGRGVSIRKIADQFKVSRDTITKGIDRARKAGIPDLEILMPAFLTPSSQCEHRPIVEGDLVFCVRCNMTGIESHPALAISPAAMPKRDRKPRKPKSAATGKERRVKQCTRSREKAS